MKKNPDCKNKYRLISWLLVVILVTLNLSVLASNATTIDSSTGNESSTSTAVEEECNHRFTYTKNYKKATCGVEGYTGDTYCEDCGKLIESGEVIPATGNHTYSSDLTCIQDTEDVSCHYWVKTCTVCGATKIIKKQFHNFLLVASKAPTSKADGYIKEYCQDCDYLFETPLKYNGSYDWNGELIDDKGNRTITVMVQDNQWSEPVTYGTYSRAELNKKVGLCKRLYSFNDKASSGYCVSVGYDFMSFLQYVFKGHDDFLSVLSDTGNKDIEFTFKANDGYQSNKTYSCNELFGLRYFYPDLADDEKTLAEKEKSKELVAPMLAVYEARAKNQSNSYDSGMLPKEAGDNKSMRITFGQSNIADSQAGNTIATINTIIVRLNNEYTFSVTDNSGNSVENGMSIDIDGNNQLHPYMKSNKFSSILGNIYDPSDFKYTVRTKDQKVLTIDSYGRITTHSKGTATVTVSYKGNAYGSYTMKFKIKVGGKGSGKGSGDGDGTGSGSGNGSGTGSGDGDGSGSGTGTGNDKSGSSTGSGDGSKSTGKNGSSNGSEGDYNASGSDKTVNSETAQGDLDKKVVVTDGSGTTVTAKQVEVDSNNKSVGSIKSIKITKDTEDSGGDSSGGSEGGGGISIPLVLDTSTDLALTTIITAILAIVLLIGGAGLSLANYQHETNRISKFFKKLFIKKG